MARSIISLRPKAPPRAISALMRSALSVFSWSISAPQTPTILSLSSAAAAAATHGAGSISTSLAGSAPAANATGESAAHTTNATTIFVTLKQPRIDGLARSFRYRRDRSKRAAIRTAADLQQIDHVVPAHMRNCASGAGTHHAAAYRFENAVRRPSRYTKARGYGSRIGARYRSLVRDDER